MTVDIIKMSSDEFLFLFNIDIYIMNYPNLHAEIQALMSDEDNFIANASNLSAL